VLFSCGLPNQEPNPQGFDVENVLVHDQMDVIRLGEPGHLEGGMVEFDMVEHFRLALAFPTTPIAG
jgi:hypothetical protein